MSLVFWRRDRVLNEVTWNHVFVRYDYGYGLWLLRMDRISNQVTWNHIFIRYDHGHTRWLLRMDRVLIEVTWNQVLGWELGLVYLHK